VARRLDPVKTPGGEWDRDPWLLGCPNGIVDLRTGVLRPGERTDFVTHQVSQPFDAEAPCERWRQFIGEVFEGDVALINFIHKALGYSLTGSMSEQVFFLLLGTGSNGKSIFLDTLEHIWGSYGQRANMKMFVGSGDLEKFHLADLAGRRLVFAAETQAEQKWKEHTIKNFTGGETQRVEKKFGDPFTFQPVGKIWLGMNHQPKVGDDSFGFWRRVRLIPFNRVFTGSAADPMLKETLRAEAPGILAWCVRGALRWQAEGLQAPASVMNATDAYQQGEDPLAEFLLARTEQIPNAEASLSALFAAYSSWADVEGIRREDRLTRRAFTSNLKRWFQPVIGQGTSRFKGVRLVFRDPAEQGLYDRRHDDRKHDEP
jgi:putative DNA primase/helicase